MGIFDFLISIISPFTIIFIVAGIGGGIVIGRQFRPQAKNQVNYIEPKSMTGYDLDIEEQSALVLHCGDVKGLPHKRFLKKWPGIEIRKGKNILTRYWAMEGSAFTLRMDEEDVKITPAEYLKTLWGEDVYNAMDQDHRAPIEKATIAITVRVKREVHKLLNPTTGLMETIPEDDYYRAIEDKIPQIIAEGVEDVGKAPLLEKVAWIGCGFGIACALFILRVFVI